MINHENILILLYGQFMEKYIHILITLKLIVKRNSYQYLDNLHFHNFMVHLYVQ